MEKRKILVEKVPCHVRLSAADFHTLFGADSVLKERIPFSDGTFISFTKAEIKGPLCSIVVPVIGPFTEKSCAVLSKTEADIAGFEVPVRLYGDFSGTGGFALSGDLRSIELSEGVFAAKRHIHINNDCAKDFRLKDGDNVCVKIESGVRKIIFSNVAVVISGNCPLPVMHIDEDEANAAAIETAGVGEIIESFI